MRHTQETRQLWNDLDILDNQIADLKRRREELDEWMQEAIAERTEVLRQLSAMGIEPEYA
jgi:predicted nuclease with TOPRIM domain